MLNNYCNCAALKKMLLYHYRNKLREFIMSRYFKKLWPFASIEASTELDSKIIGSDFETF